ncbi:MAG: ParA family protein [Bacteroidales bacterium]|nr:ParA family protein [Bacteroidales bacterium]
MKVFALYNVKGGVGKTSAAVNLAYLSSTNHFKTLLWDLDSQGAGTYCLCRNKIEVKMKDWIKGDEKASAFVFKTKYKDLFILPSDISLRHLDSYLAGINKPKHRISDILSQLKDQFNMVFLDCPPGISKLAENIFYAADYILMPAIPSPLSFNSFQSVSRFLGKKGFNNQKLIPFFSMVDLRRKMHKDNISVLKRDLNNICLNYIPYLSDIEKMSEMRKPVPLSMPRSKAAMAYLNLWEEIIAKTHIASSGALL